MDIEKEFLTLSQSIHTFLGKQKTWNAQHDIRSRQALEHIKKEQTRISKEQTSLSNRMGEIQTQIAAIPCPERKVEIDANQKINDEKIKSAEKRIKWLWVIGGANSTVAIAAVFFKLYFS